MSGIATNTSSRLATVAAITTSTTPTQFASAPAQKGVLVQADTGNGAVNVRIGDASVSTTRGFQLAAGASFLFPVDDAGMLWWCAESGTPKINVVVM